MRLLQVTVLAAPDTHPNEAHTYTWSHGTPLAHLDIAISKLTECRDELKAKESDPTATQKPIET